MSDPAVAEVTKALTRNEMRTLLIGKRHEASSEIVTLFGVEVEIKQPSLGTIVSVRDSDDVRQRTADVFINYAYVPGTNELVFESTDRETILDWPFTEDLLKIQAVIVKLTGINIGDAIEELKNDPLDESP